jgi:hypothetical protein
VGLAGAGRTRGCHRVAAQSKGLTQQSPQTNPDRPRRAPENESHAVRRRNSLSTKIPKLFEPSKPSWNMDVSLRKYGSKVVFQAVVYYPMKNADYASLPAMTRQRPQHILRGRWAGQPHRPAIASRCNRIP